MPIVAACQLRLAVGLVDQNRSAARQAVEDAVAGGAQLIVLPELTPSGYVFADLAEARSLAEPAYGATCQEWLELSRRHHVVIVGGICEAGPGGIVLNSSLVIDDGVLLAVYRKVHLWDRETMVFTRGDQPPPVVATTVGRVATMICYDLEFPEWTRLAGLAGADVLAAPTNWPSGPRPAQERPIEVVRVQATASVNRMAVVAADRCGRERSVDWVGGSVVVDQDGYPVAGPVSADEPVVLLADLDLTASRTKRISDHNDVLADRRPDLYGTPSD
jgi:predicted amidohydrolase